MTTRGFELSTVGLDFAVLHRGVETVRLDGLDPGRDHEHAGLRFRTLEHPGGQLLARFATVNDVHFGETICGYIEGLETPVLSVADGEEPYPQLMNRHAIAEIAALEPDVVVVKGDLTSEGLRSEYQQFVDAYGTAFGDRLVHIRGNHDVYGGDTFAPQGPYEIALPGVVIAVIDTAVPEQVNGAVDTEQLEWLDELASRADRPVLVFGHHHIWDPDHDVDNDFYFGIRPDPSRRLIEVFARRPGLAGYFAGHTHRNRVVRLAATGPRPWAEVASVKDFPGSWAEYQVYEGGIVQIHHRISAPDALAWTNRTRVLYAPVDYVDYAFGSLSDRCFRIR